MNETVRMWMEIAFNIFFLYLALYEVEVDDWEQFAKEQQTAFAEGRITVDVNLLSLDPMVKTMVFEQVGEQITP